MTTYMITTSTLVCTPVGRLDTPAAQALEAELAPHLTDVTSVEFDLHQVDYICSMFLRIVLTSIKTLGAGNVRITHAAPSVLKVLKIANIPSVGD